MRPFIWIVLCCLLLAACDHIYTETAHTRHDATLAQQKMCDEQAAKRFEEYEDTEDYTSHYAPKENICYVRINFQRTSTGKSALVVDAFEKRTYAIWVRPESGGQVTCLIDIPGKPTIICGTSTEFDQLTEKYFGIASF